MGSGGVLIGSEVIRLHLACSHRAGLGAGALLRGFKSIRETENE